ncbi:hypothetical protein PanWU01x14_234210 [Parasponia andersonii]|uniref:Uncharacterized protein n=1 Tax=Parasponia andersonii TaxID=3476 RepID=A0A2P5BJC6_PARAD|nr:hypothetical protein PanWU01x14_234210 [Parasponia andersonii]
MKKHLKEKDIIPRVIIIFLFEWKRIGEEEINMVEAPGLSMARAEPLEVLCKPNEVMIKLLSTLKILKYGV